MAEATIYDVARHAGVSIATVSRVLNSPARVREPTRARVLAAIDELEFVPRAEATARARRATGRIGVLAPFFTYPSFTQRLRGVAAALIGTDYELVIYYIDTAERRDAYLASLAVGRRLDGLIIMSLPVDAPSIHRLLGSGIEVVLIETGHSALSSIEIDERAGGRLVAELFAALGHQRCGFVGDSQVPPYALHTSERRCAAYRQRLLELGLNLPDAYIALAPHGMDAARASAHRLLALETPPTAIFTPSDTQAIGVLKAARERGLRVPEDLAIVGFDDIDMADYIGLTTVRQPLDDSGRLAAQLLLSQLSHTERTRRQLHQPLALVRRETA